jgi:hypothetical protein
MIVSRRKLLTVHRLDMGRVTGRRNARSCPVLLRLAGGKSSTCFLSSSTNRFARQTLAGEAAIEASISVSARRPLDQSAGAPLQNPIAPQVTERPTHNL